MPNDDVSMKPVAKLYQEQTFVVDKLSKSFETAIDSSECCSSSKNEKLPDSCTTMFSHPYLKSVSKQSLFQEEI